MRKERLSEAVITYIVWPSVQFLRPEEFANDNFCTRLLGLIYGFDTPTGVCPSLHVGYTLSVWAAWIRKKKHLPKIHKKELERPDDV